MPFTPHPLTSKRMKGNLRDVIEVSVSDDSGDRTFRTTCTTTIGDVVYVLHAFQRKAKSGIARKRVRSRMTEIVRVSQ